MSNAMSDDALSDMSLLWNKLDDARQSFWHREDEHPACKRAYRKLERLMVEIAAICEKENIEAETHGIDTNGQPFRYETQPLPALNPEVTT